jgi:hypothetical protein
VTDREELLAIVESFKDAVKKSDGKPGAPKKRSPSSGKKVVYSTPAPSAGTSLHEGLDLLGEPTPPTGADYVSDPALSPSEKLRRLRAEEIGDCRRCPLGATRIKLAFGVGNPSARVMFIGEGPGYQEDRQGEPFVGPAGKLLDKILEATELSRQQREPAWSWVYIANMVKCHPLIDPSDNTKRGNDRPPSTEEMADPFTPPSLRGAIFATKQSPVSGEGECFSVT